MGRSGMGPADQLPGLVRFAPPFVGRKGLMQRQIGGCWRRLWTHHRMAGTILCSAALMASAVNSFADTVGARRSGPELRTIRVARQQGSQARAVHVRAVVTYYDSVAPNLFVQDETGGIWVDLRGLRVPPPQVGDVLDIHAEVGKGFSPYLAHPAWRMAGHSAAPRPIRLTYEQALTGTADAQWAEMEGVVRSFVQQVEGSVLVIDVATPTGSFKVRIPDYRAGFPLRLVDAKVRFDGVLGAVFNRRNQLVAINLLVPSPQFLQVMQPAPADPFAVASTPVADIRRYTGDMPDIHRVKVSGIVTARFPQQGLFLMDSTGGVYAESQDGTSVDAGDAVEVIGFPVAGEYSPVLRSASIVAAHRHQDVTPTTVTGKEALHGTYDAQLVKITGTVRSYYYDGEEPVLVLESGDHTTFEASRRLQNQIAGTARDDKWLLHPVGSRITLTGICSVKTDENGNPAAFRIVLRSPKDIAVLSSPPWLTARRALMVFAILISVSIAILAWVGILRRRVREQTQVIKINLEKKMALEERYRSIFERNMTGLYIASREGSIIDCNDACAQILGFANRDALLQHVDAAEQIVKQLNEVTDPAAPLVNAEHRFRRYDGSWAWALSNARLVPRESDGTLVIEGALVDITDLKRAQDQVQRLAYYDSLTGLPNRMLFRDRLSKALAGARRRGEKLAVLFVDVDRLKTINDSLGHDAGDLLLEEIGQRLAACSREQDTVARIAGDEFLVALGSLENASDAAVVAERIGHALSADFNINGNVLRSTCSIGISIFPDHGDDVETLIRNADAAMYSSKDDGRNTFRFFTAQMTAEAVSRLRLETNLRSALEKQQLFLMYQPEIDARTGEITCWEALLRWQNPELGLVPPDTFIPVAESSGMMLPIGEWVLRTACAQAKEWQESGAMAVPVAVNVSAVQFRQENFCAAVRAALEESGLSPEFLELELTESLLLSTGERTLQVLHELKAMGVRLAIDDFGTGYSSLSYLKQFPVSKLKVDRSFIDELGANNDDAAITAAIINMARCLNLRVTAEGVESEAQLSILRRYECDEVQGYLFSKPLPAEQIIPALHSELGSRLDRLIAGHNNIRRWQVMAGLHLAEARR